MPAPFPRNQAPASSSGWRLDQAESIRTDVDQHVAALADHVDQGPSQFVAGFPSGIPLDMAPAAVHGQAALASPVVSPAVVAE